MQPTVIEDRPAASAEELLSLRLWLQLMKCSKSVEASVSGRLRRGYGQSLSRFDVLSQLERLDGDWMAIGELARMVMAASGNITALLDRMEAEALVERRASPKDRRSFQVRMTARGRRLFASMAEDHMRWIDDALLGVPTADKQRLIELLVAVRRRLGERLSYLCGLPTAEVYAAAYKALGVPVYSSAVFNFIPKTAMDFYHAIARDDHATVGKLIDNFFLPFLEIRKRGAGYAVSIVKAGAKIAGYDAGPVRAPLTKLKSDEYECLAALIDRLGPQ